MNLQLISDLSLDFKQNNNIIPNIRYVYKYSLTRSYYIGNIEYDFSRTMGGKLEDIFLESISKEYYFDALDTPIQDSIHKLINFINYNRYDFIIVNAILSRHFISSSLFEGGETSKHSNLSFFYYGKIGGIDLYAQHSFDYDDSNMIICGKKNMFEYNYKYDFFESEVENGVEILLNYYFGYKIQKEDFLNLYFVHEIKPKYKSFIRDKIIGDFLDE